MEANEFGTYPNDPVLWRKYLGGEELMDEDFTRFTVKTPSRFDRGAKKYSEYVMEEDRKKAVSKTFIDTFDGNGALKISVKFDFYREDGELYSTKTQLVKEYSLEETEEVLEKRRMRQMAFLRSSVKGTPYESYVAALFTYFKEQESSYVRTGSMDFDQAINDTLAIDLATLPAEQAQIVGQIQGILVAEVPRVDDPTTNIAVMNAIKYQMGTYQLPEVVSE